MEPAPEPEPRPSPEEEHEEQEARAEARATLETLRDANIKIWMLTGDKLETAMAIARNASLVPRRQPFYPVRVRCAAEVRRWRGAISAIAPPSPSAA